MIYKFKINETVTDIEVQYNGFVSKIRYNKINNGLEYLLVYYQEGEKRIGYLGTIYAESHGGGFTVIVNSFKFRYDFILDNCIVTIWNRIQEPIRVLTSC